MPRLWNFQGSDAEYIRYLECKVLEAQHPSRSSAQWELDQGPPPDSTHHSPIHFIIWQPQNEASLGRKRYQAPRWKKELDSFVSSLPRHDGWEAARRDAGLYTTEQNRRAVHLLLGQTSTRGLGPSCLLITEVLSIHPTDDRELVIRGCRYGQWITACAEENNFTRRVVNFQKLIFTSYCAVLLHLGNAKDTVRAMMEQYLGRRYDAKTLDYYRYGSLWANRCMASLLQQGWGPWSWELFLLQTRTPAQFGRFAISASQSYGEVVKQIGPPPVMADDSRWIPYCLPCIVQELMGDTIE
ncbi:hypothetical protein BJX76DRAFT_40684 [Aspergillus varians]